MGLPFKDIARGQPIRWADLSGRAVAVDAYNALYQFLATIRQADGQPFSDPEGRPTSHLIGTLYRTTSLLAAGVRPAWVFDGHPPSRKAGTIRDRIAAKERARQAWDEALAAGDWETARRKASQTSRLTAPMVEETVALLKALGMPAVRAPGEGEAQAAILAAEGTVWATASEDYDTLLFGAPRLVRGLAARRGHGAEDAATLIDRARWLEELGISADELILMGILVGTDFNEGVRGIGPKKALRLVQQHLGWDETVRRAGLDPVEAGEVAAIFRTPSATPGLTLRFGEPDPEAVVRLLVDGHGFAEARVRGALARLGTGPKRATAAPPGTETVRRRQAVLDGYAEGSPG
ncbi:MAG: flap structure-specific endonuclease [Thermoplasmata archaeon]